MVNINLAHITNIKNDLGGEAAAVTLKFTTAPHTDYKTFELNS